MLESEPQRSGEPTWAKPYTRTSVETPQNCLKRADHAMNLRKAPCWLGGLGVFAGISLAKDVTAQDEKMLIA